ncbi:MAG TPA: NADPH:quinone reductase [Rhodopila sp.]|uniref:NADPH:quinone reductase n=1 Tax=Rhodopila sp. TaxID=2480087 RepID=UPI002B74BC78|nr:NADPH:quinone reductase [Rhodopila sp.]HVY17982.1 NADPH:quinone reductase [Rhodopila sp.]
MLAGYYERKGSAHGVLRVGEVPDPIPGPNEVRVRVRVSGVNPSDTKQREGWGQYASMPWPRIIPHNDGAGMVEAVGPGVDPARIGERVWVYEAQRDGRALGTCATYVVVPADHAVRLPEGIDDDTAAALGVPAMTAHRCLFIGGPVAGKTVLVAGGAGAVGQCAVQLARWGGAGRIIATAGSDAQAAVARASGADDVLNYRDPDLVARLRAAVGGDRAIDHIVEVSFSQNIDLDAAVLKPGGSIASYFNGPDGAPTATVPYAVLSSMCITVYFVLVYTMGRTAHDQAACDINAALTAGMLRPRIAQRFPLTELVAAHEAVGLNGRGGKVLVAIP